MPNYVGGAAPEQVVKIRLGRFSRYYQENPVHTAKDREEPGGAGHQTWDNANYPCGAHVGTTGSNPNYFFPWQALWIPAAGAPGEYKVVPNVQEVKKDKKLEIGGIETCTIQVENILYPSAAGGYHVRERGAMSPLRGLYAHGDAGAPNLPQLLDELGVGHIAPNEWEGRFAYAAQITIWQGYGELIKTFTGLIEDVDATSHPDRLVLTCRDFGQVFSEEHFMGWGKDPVIDTPVVFVDQEQASTRTKVGYNSNATSAAEGNPSSKVIDNDLTTSWQSLTDTSAEDYEFVEIALPEGFYKFADLHVLFAGMEMWISLKPNKPLGSSAPRRNGILLTMENKKLDKNGWVDPTEKEEQVLKITSHGKGYEFSYTNHFAEYPTGPQRPPIQTGEPNFEIGGSSVLRLTFRKLHKIEAGEHFRAGVLEMHGLRETKEEGAALAQWVVTEDISDVVRVICQWAGFKEWDIEDTGARLPVRIVAFQGETWLDVIKRVAEGVGWNFYMKDPTPDGEPLKGGSIESRGGSLGVPTFKRPQATINDSITKPEPDGNPFAGPELPKVYDREMLTAIQVKQSNEALAYVIRVYGRTASKPGDLAAAIPSGKRLVYTFRPPWAGTPPYYANTRLGGILKKVVHHDPFFSTEHDVEQAAFLIALAEALASIEATIECPFIPARAEAPAKRQPPDIEDHLLLMDLGTGVSTRLSITSRQSTFTDGEKRRFSVSFSGPLIDSPDVRDMVKIILGDTTPNGEFKEWANPKEGTASSLGYG